VTFSSSDGVLFKIHRKYLEVNAGAFPPAEFATNDETVMLTESSAILELLFQFVYPKQHPDVDDIEPFELFAGVAEAAEKYEIYPAMSTCKLRMRLVVISASCHCLPKFINTIQGIRLYDLAVLQHNPCMEPFLHMLVNTDIWTLQMSPLR
jgi:hypothetical protein